MSSKGDSLTGLGDGMQEVKKTIEALMDTRYGLAFITSSLWYHIAFRG